MSNESFRNTIEFYDKPILIITYIYIYMGTRLFGNRQLFEFNRYNIMQNECDNAVIVGRIGSKLPIYRAIVKYGSHHSIYRN